MAKSKKYIFLFCCLFIFVFSFCFSVKIIDTVGIFFDKLLIESGYNLKKITISAEKNISQKEVYQNFKYFLGSNTFTLPVFSIKQKIEQMPWCKNAVVAKKLPNELEIIIKEHEPFAIFNNKEIVTEEFYKIIDFDKATHSDLDLIAIKSSKPQKAREFLKVLQNNLDKQAFAKIKSVEHVAERRWDIVMKNDLVIKLPEQDPVSVLQSLSNYYDAKFSVTKTIDARASNTVYLM